MADMIYTGVRYCRRKILIESTGNDEVDAALKEMWLRDFTHVGRGANEMWRPHCKIVMRWMTDKDAQDEQKKKQREHDKYPLLELTAKGE